MTTMLPREPDLACQSNPDMWFTPSKYDRAKALCQGCPIYKQCQEIGWKHEYGVFGGLSEYDRGRSSRSRSRGPGRPKRTPTKCTFPGCENAYAYNGYCRKHAMRLYMHGDPAHVPYSHMAKNSRKCIFPGCDDPFSSKDLCVRHYNRALKAGGDMLGGREHGKRTEDIHTQVHKLMYEAIDEWRRGGMSERCHGLIVEALEISDGYFTRGEMEAAVAMGAHLIIDEKYLPTKSRAGILPEEVKMRWEAILQLRTLGLTRTQIANDLGVSTKTVDRALRCITVMPLMETIT